MRPRAPRSSASSRVSKPRAGGKSWSQRFPRCRAMRSRITATGLGGNGELDRREATMAPFSSSRRMSVASGLKWVTVLEGTLTDAVSRLTHRKRDRLPRFRAGDFHRRHSARSRRYHSGAVGGRGGFRLRSALSAAEPDTGRTARSGSICLGRDHPGFVVVLCLPLSPNAADAGPPCLWIIPIGGG